MFSLKELDLQKWFEDSPAGQSIIADRREEYLSERQSKVDELESLAAEGPGAVKAVNATVKKAAREHEAAKKALEKKEAALRAAKAERHNVGYRFSNRRSVLESQLVATADPAIDEFIAEMRQLHDAERHVPITREEEMYTDGHGHPRVHISGSSLPSIVRRNKAIGEAIEQAQQLRLTVCEDVVEELEKIRDSLPEVIVEPTNNPYEYGRQPSFEIEE